MSLPTTWRVRDRRARRPAPADPPLRRGADRAALPPLRKRTKSFPRAVSRSRHRRHPGRELSAGVRRGRGDLTHGLVVADALVYHGRSVERRAAWQPRDPLPLILNLGSAEQKERYVPLRGEKSPRWPSPSRGAGSDVANLTTRAVRDGDHYVVKRQQDLHHLWRAGGHRGGGGAHLAGCVAASPRAVALGRRARHAGFSASRKLKKTGWWSSDTAELSFSDRRVPVQNRLGDEGAGFFAIIQNFAAERPLLAAQCIAVAQLAYDESVSYARTRQAFGKALTGFQVTRHKLADMATRIVPVRALVGDLATRLSRGQATMAEVAMAKNAATDMCSFVCDQAVQLHGGMGYMRETLVERLYRDARLFPIGGARARS